MELTITLTQQQLNYLINEAEATNSTKEEVIKRLLDIQLELQTDLEADLTLDMWDDEELDSRIV